jgi:Zn-dependent peptidase ImmA (M78 family)
MSTSQQAFVTKDVLTWARKRLGDTIESASHKLKIEPDTLKSWEDGTTYPTMTQAKRIAKKLTIPFGYLFLSTPPEDLKVPLPDFRSVTVRETSEVSPEFSDLFNDVLVKQDWYKQHLIEKGKKPLKFVGSHSIASGIDQVAASIGDAIDIEAHRTDAVSWADFLRRLITSAESIGVIVMKSGVVGANNQRPLSVDEFRGFAIADSIAPLVFINGRDAVSAQIFTLIHELAHIWIASDGISRPDLSKKSSRQPNDVERFCDSVAVEVLVPHEAFLAAWDNDASIDSNIHELARRFHVSLVVVLRRAYDLDELTSDEFTFRLNREFRREARPKSDGGNFYATVRVRNSGTLTDALVESALTGRVLLLDAAKMLHVKIGTIEKMPEKMPLRKT